MPTLDRITDTSLARAASRWVDTLRCDGWCVIPKLLPGSEIAALNRRLDADFSATPYCEGGFYGARTKRFGRLLTRASSSAALVGHPLVVAIAQALLGGWCDTIQLNLTQAIEIHPGERAQVPHRDQDMWGGVKGAHEYLLNVMWPLTPFRAENGATMIWPGSHGASGAVDPSQVSGVAAECDPGGAILFLGSTLHHGGANRSSAPRRGIVTGYSLGWLKTYENQFLAYPPAIAQTFAPELAALIGYRQHRPNLGNYEGRCPSILLQGNVPEHLAARDALTPEQEAMIADHIATEDAAPSEPPRR